jgi:DNA-binding XRE family transcriptional regulator
MNEVWRDIPGWEEMYQVSNKGRIKSLKRFVKRSDGRLQPIPEAILTGDVGEYIRVYLRTPGYKIRKFVHRIVAEVFIPNPEGYRTVNHLNGNKYDNNVDNLEWASHSMNVLHAYENGLAVHAVGVNWHNSKLNDDKVREIRSRYSDGGVTMESLAKEFGVSRKTLSKAIEGKTWRHVDPIKNSNIKY